MGPTYMMRANETRNIAAIQFVGEHPPTAEEVQHRTQAARLIIKYESIYREKFRLDTDQLRPLPGAPP
jgi:hypothetical protein